MKKHVTYVDASRQFHWWGREVEKVGDFSHEDMMLGTLLRIADALERLAGLAACPTPVRMLGALDRIAKALTKPAKKRAAKRGCK